MPPLGRPPTPPREFAFDAHLIRRDMAAKGWIAKDLALAAGIAELTASRFLRGLAQSPRIAKKIATALDRTPGDYLLDLIHESREATR
jgi:transcriptional regulator with XRE-family HTH domain